MTDPMRLNNRHNGTGAVDQAAMALVGLLADEGRKAPRVVARKVAEHLERLGLLAGDDDELEPAGGHIVYGGKRPDPPSWLRFSKVIEEDPTGKPEPPIAVTRNRTEAAMTALGLDPREVRAVVIERDELRVYSYRDRGEWGQTMPIMPDKETQ